MTSGHGREGKQSEASLGKNIAWNTIGSLTYQGCMWLITVLVVVLSGGFSDSGALALAMTVGNVYEPIAAYNMRVYQASDISGDYSQSTYIGMRIVTMTSALVIVIPYSAAVTTDMPTLIAVLAFLLFKMNEVFCDALYGVDQRYERMDFIGISQLVRGIGVLVCFTVGMAAGKSLPLAIVVMLAFCMVVTLAYDIPRSRTLDRIRPTFSGKSIRRLLKSCLPLALTTLLLNLVVSSSRQCFSWTYGVDALGVYAAVATPAVLVQALARYLYSPVLVPLAQAYQEEGVQRFKRALLKYGGVLVIGVIAMVAVLSVIGGPALTLVYGDRVSDYVYLFPYVLICTASIAFVLFLTDVLVVLRDLRGGLIANALALVVCLALVTPLEQAFYMNGINMVIAVSMLASIACALWRIVRALRVG